MSITLDATLKTAQDGDSHRPIVEIISRQDADVIPIHGNYFNTDTTEEDDPSVIILSDGRLAAIYDYGNALRYMYTPTDRSEWINVTVTTPSTPSDPCLCELTNGNIGIIFKSSGKLYYKIITVTGTIVTDSTELYDPSGNWIGNPYVITLANDTYLMVYAEGVGTPPEGDTYNLKMFTSSNFTSWNGPTTITVSGLSTDKYKDNPHLLQLSGGRIYLHFDYMTDYVNSVEINNLFSVYSDDNGTSWSTPYQITSEDELGTTLLHPVAVEDEGGTLTFVYVEKSNVRKLNETMTGWPYGAMHMDWLWYNHADQKIYFQHGVGGIMDIDIESWGFERGYTGDTSPAIPNPVTGRRGVDEYTLHSTSAGVACVINHNTETVINLVANSDADGYEYNYVTGRGEGHRTMGFIRKEGSQVQVWFMYRYGPPLNSHDNLELGYVDITNPPDPITGLYPWTEIYRGANPFLGLHNVHRIFYDETCDWIVFTGEYQYYEGGMCILDATGGLVKLYGYQWNSLFPRDGVHEAIIDGDYIYFSFGYYSGQPDKRGLGRIDMNTDNIEYYQPSMATVNNYGLHSIIKMEGTTKLAMLSTSSEICGILTFDTQTFEWTLYNEESLPGIRGSCGSCDWRQADAGGGNHVDLLAYDPVAEVFYAGHQDCGYLVTFSIEGDFSVLNYATVTNPATTAEYGEADIFSYEAYEDKPVITYDEDYMLWILWRHRDDDEYSILWANTIASKDVTNYLDINIPITIEWDIDKPAKLTFAVSHGYLFDPQNLLSTFSIFFKRARLLSIRQGEIVSDVEYWQNQSMFEVIETSLEYSTNEYPTLKVVAEDMTHKWGDNHIIATEYYNGENPVDVLEWLLSNHAELEADEYNLPVSFEDTHDLYHQYIDMNFDEIIKSLLDHFCYFPHVNIDGEFEPRYLDISKSVDHEYSDTTQITKYTPDGKYATFINQIIVTGISHIYYEILYEEEVVGRLSGTTGWWGKDNDEKVWYSNNHTKTCRYPRLEILQSVTDFEVFNALSGSGGESITDVDTDEQYCIVTIEAPNLIGVLAAAIAAAVATYTFCKHSCDGGPHQKGWCSICNFAVILEINLIISILCGVASYSYNIWARPIGHEKRSHQATANDYDFQEELNGKIIAETIDDPYGYTVSICQTVADNEMGLISAQRRRHKFIKTAHLMDEIGDVISIPHPYSGETMRTMIVNLKREMKIGKYWLDHIEGWRLVT